MTRNEWIAWDRQNRHTTTALDELAACATYCESGTLTQINVEPRLIIDASREAERLVGAIHAACAIIEMADARNLACDGPASGSPPRMTLAEWKNLYTLLAESVARAHR